MSLTLENVVKRVGGDTHIPPTSLRLRPDGFNVLLGATLAGKTSLMRLMAGLDRPSEGRVFDGDRDVTGVPVARRNVAMVYQQFINFPNMSVADNIASPLRVAGMDRVEIEKRVKRAAELLRLTPMLARRPLELSGGQQQRTAIARALVKDAGLVLLDEPLANLDYKLREELRDELPKLFADRNTTVVYATTEPSEALLLGGATATLHEGRVTAFDDTSTLYRAPPDLRSALVFSDPPINVAPVEKRGGTLSLGPTLAWSATGAAAALPDGRYMMAIRPHHVALAASGPVADMIAVDGSTLLSEISGSETVVHAELPGLDGPLAWVSQSHGVYPHAVGAPARLRVAVGRALFFGADEKRVA